MSIDCGLVPGAHLYVVPSQPAFNAMPGRADRLKREPASGLPVANPLERTQMREKVEINMID